MAAKKKEAPKKVTTGVRIRKTETVRERTEQSRNKDLKPKRLRKAGSSVKRPLQAIVDFGRKEYYLPMPKNKVGTFLNKRRSFTPRYFIDAFKELRQVTWPSAQETTKLTIAVIMFAVIFCIIVATADYVLDYVFKKVIL